MTTDTVEPEIDADFTLDEVLARVEENDVIDMSEESAGRDILTIEHYGRFPPKDLLGNYIDVLATALGDPDDFDQYSIQLDSHKTTIERTNIPISELCAKRDVVARARDDTLTETERTVFEAAAKDMDTTIAEVAEQACVSVEFVRRVLRDKTPP